MTANSIERFIEDQAFPPSYGEGEGGGGGGAKPYNGEKAWYSINHSILSGWRCYLQKTFGHILNGKTAVYSFPQLFASCYSVFLKIICKY